MSPQARALELLISGKSAPQVAAVVGVDARTIRRWKLEPDFARELAEIRKTVYDDVLLRTMALIDQLHDACFENLFWLREVSLNGVKITDRLRCMAALNSHGFRWARYIMERREKQNEKLLAQTAKPLAKKADINGRTSAPGATGAPTAVPSVHPCPVDSPTQKADVNGHAIPPTDPELLALKAHRAYRTRIAAAKAPSGRSEKRTFAGRQIPIAGRV